MSPTDFPLRSFPFCRQFRGLKKTLRGRLVAPCILLLAVVFGLRMEAADTALPNFIVILADDLGYGDVSFNGSELIHTPNIDRLAASGRVMDNFHSNDSVCSPTRAALLTGRYQHRSGVVNVLGQTGMAMMKIRPENPFLGLELSEILIPERLNEVGYVTGCFGKWHLGPLETHGPNAQGFDTFFGVDGFPYNDFTYTYKGINRLYRGDHTPAPGEGGRYFTYRLADEVNGFIENHRRHPFFAYVPFTAPHIPLWGPDDADLPWNESNRFGPREDTQQVYIEVIEALDKAVGEILAKLEELGLEKNTVVIFTSDNGPIDLGSAAPYFGRKANLYEGATRVPTIISWPGTISPGRSETLAATMDIKPTLLALAGLRPLENYPLDGVDLSPLLLHDETLPVRSIYFEKPQGVHMYKFDWRRFAVREGDWRLVDDGAKLHRALFNIREDPGQKHDLSDKYPERTASMVAGFEKWKAEVYADAPYDLKAVIDELKQAEIIRPRQTVN